MEEGVEEGVFRRPFVATCSLMLRAGIYTVSGVTAVVWVRGWQQTGLQGAPSSGVGTVARR